MATSFLSPGVYVREIDFSVYVPNLSTTALGLVGYATKGPINEPVYVSNPVEFSTNFGDPSTSFMAPYAALQYLGMGRQLWYVRVAEPEDDDAEIAKGYIYKSRPSSITLNEAVTKATITGTKTNIVTLTSENNQLVFKIDGSNVTLTVTLDLGTSTSLPKSISDIAAMLNGDNNFAAYFTASLSATGALTIERNIAGSDHGFIISSPLNKYGLGDILGFNNVPQTVWGIGSIDEKAYVMANKVFASFTASTTPDTLNKLTFILDGQATTITLPSATYSTVDLLVAALNSDSTFNTHLTASVVSGNVFVAIKADSTKKLLMLGTNADSVADAGPTIFGNLNAAKYIVGPAVTVPVTIQAGVNDILTFTVAEATALPATSETYSITITPATYATLSDLLDAVNAALVLAVKTSDGSVVDLSSVLTAADVTTSASISYTGSAEYVVYDTNSTAFTLLFGNQPNQKWSSTTAADVLTVTALSDGTWGNRLAVQVKNVNTVNGTFDFFVYERGYLVERYIGLVKTPEVLTDGSDNPLFVEHAVNSTSQRVFVTNGTGSGEGLLPIENTGNSLSYLAGGNDGTATVTNPSTFIGVSSETATTGLQLFRNPEQLDVNLLAVPGISSAAVINAMTEICIFRRDCMCLVDPPNPLEGTVTTPQEAVNWVNGTGAWSSDHAAFNSSYAALYWPWLQIYDSVNKTTVWTPPSGHLAYVYAYTDYNSETWSAPAGLNRGHLVSPIKAWYVPTLGDRDLLYSNNINPIATFIRDGINVWGQKTLQRNPTALDRVNVRRLMLYLEKIVATAARTLVFEPTDRATWIQFTNLIEPFLDSVKARRGVLEYKVICDETTNTPDVQDRNEMRARIYIRPTKTAEFISVDFILTDSGTSFSELTY